MKRTCSVIFLLCLGCHSSIQPPPVHITLTDSNRSVKFTGLDKTILNEIGRDTTADIWENLIPVYRMPADTDMKNYQPTQHGRYLVRDSSVVFTPDTPFMKGQVYFIRYYRFDKGGSPWDRLTGQKAPGASHYTDLIFKQ